MRQRFSQFRLRRERRTESPPAPAPDPRDGEDGAAAIVRPALVVGFGNPGERYAATRHNVGAWCVRELAARHRVRLERRGKVELAVIEVDGRGATLGRARTFYNDCGPPIAAELRRQRLDPARLLVIYDEVDLPVAQVRIRKSGGTGGNNGMKSLIGAVGTQGFARIRIGIDRPYDAGIPVREPERIADWVLTSPGGPEREALHAAVGRAADAVETAIREGIDIAMNRFNPR